MREANEARIEHAGGWTEPRISILKLLWADGLSASQIAAELGGGVTRSGVIGKVHRLKLHKREPMVASKAKRISSPQRATKNEHGGLSFKIAQARKDGLQGDEAMEAVLGHATRGEPLGDAFPADGGLVRLEALGNADCRWPFGDPLTKDFGFCGRPKAEGEVYCPDHCCKAYPGWQP